MRHGAHRDAPLPRSPQRRSPGLSREAQTLCFLAGANSIFYGDRLLTTANPDEDADVALLADLGIRVAVETRVAAE